MQYESTDRVWKEFVDSLTLCLGELNDQEYLILNHRGSPYYLQFANDGKSGMRAEAVSNKYIETEQDKLSEAYSQIMNRLGWSLPNLEEDYYPGAGGSTNFYVNAHPPVDTASLAQLAESTLRQVFKVTAPADLQYSSFQEDLWLAGVERV